MQETTKGNNLFPEPSNQEKLSDEKPEVVNEKVYITESVKEKLLHAYEHITSDDDELAVPAFVIAESSIFVDVAILPENNQNRSHCNVITQGPAVKSLLEEMQKIYNGKVRLSITHCHQFGMDSLSSVDVQGYRDILSDPLSSKPYSDGSKIPVLLISGSGSSRKLLGFYVTPRDFYKAEIIEIPDDSEIVTEAFKRAPIAMPELPHQEVLDTISEGLGDSWNVHLARSKEKEKIVILLKYLSGEKFILELIKEWPYSFPKILYKGKDVTNQVNFLKCMDLNKLAQRVSVSLEEIIKKKTNIIFQLNTESPFKTPRIRVHINEDITDDLIFLDLLDWEQFGRKLLEISEADSYELIDPS